MSKKNSVLVISLIGIVLATVAFDRPPTKPRKMTTVSPWTRYLPEYTASGDLILPKNSIPATYQRELPIGYVHGYPALKQ